MTVTDGSGLSLQLAQHATGIQFASLSGTTVHATKRALLDAVGVISAASGLAPEATALHRPGLSPPAARPRRGYSGPTSFCPPAAAALANGALSHALDYEDAFDRAPVHPNASLIPGRARPGAVACAGVRTRTDHCHRGGM